MQSQPGNTGTKDKEGVIVTIPFTATGEDITSAHISMKSGVIFILFRLSLFLVTWSSHAARGSHDSSRFQLNHGMMGNAVSGMNKTPTGKYDENDPLSFYATTLLSTGTTICGLQCVDGVVLGADSRSTSGQLIADPNCKSRIT